jgi:hypothetical protein
MVKSVTDTRNSDKTYAAGDVVGYYAEIGTAPPVGFAELSSSWTCLGWIDTTGTTFKLAETMKNIMAAGTLDPIRTVISAAPKTFDMTFMEALNPAVRSLYDDVALSLLQPATGTTVATYVLPEIPDQNHYCFVFDSIDTSQGAQMRSFCVDGMVTTRGNDQQQQGDAETIAMTITLYPALIGSVRASIQRYINYGTADLTPFYA